MSEDNDKQLSGVEGKRKGGVKGIEGKGKKRNKKIDRWVVMVVLVLTVLVSLGFYVFSSVNVSERKISGKEDFETGTGGDKFQENKGVFGPAVYEL